MTYKEIQSLLKQMSEYDLSEIRIKDGDFEITVRTSSYTKKATQQTIMAAPQAVPMQAMAAPEAIPVAPAPVAAAPAAEEDSASNLVEVKSPIVGTFYRSASPDKPAYVSIGDRISVGSVVCIVEAMKLFNEIESEVSGKIVKVMIDDASPVEYDQVLFLVDPNG